MMCAPYVQQHPRQVSVVSKNSHSSCLKSNKSDILIENG